MKQKSNSWECVSCLAVVAFHLRRCPQCGTNKELFYVGMYQDCNHCHTYSVKTNFNSNFKKLGIIDFTLNESGKVAEILELLVCYIEINEIDHKILSSKQFIIKPYFIPLIQNEFQPITQEQADNGINFIEVFDYLKADIFIFESREKAFHFKQQCQQFNVQCPIKQFIEIGRVYPNTSVSVNTNQMMKMLKIQFSSECFALAEIVDELLARAYRFDTKMITTLDNPIPEEMNRLLGFDYIIILDFEATCDQNQNNKKSKEQQEIIEFPAQLYNVREKRIEKEFQYFVKPTNNPNLSEYCTSLTGITQEQVDQGINIADAVDKFIQFTDGLERPCILTCGDFDLFQLKKESQQKQFNIPDILKYYINIKRVFPKELNIKYPQELSMPEMLEALNMEHQGRLHSGIDDVKNITRIVDQLVQGGFRFDERMILYTFKI